MGNIMPDNHGFTRNHARKAITAWGNLVKHDLMFLLPEMGAWDRRELVVSKVNKPRSSHLDISAVTSAMAIWEGVIDGDWFHKLPQLNEWDQIGFVMDTVLPNVEKWYKYMCDYFDFDIPYDWEFVPVYLEHVDLRKKVTSCTDVEMCLVDALNRLQEMNGRCEQAMARSQD